ncbi:hypothetical protein KY386_00160 [Candidatus Parcubacteria bacterium]|nr:hypothetical protein [Candidatus Parcubacteria bacterium]
MRKLFVSLLLVGSLAGILSPPAAAAHQPAAPSVATAALTGPTGICQNVGPSGHRNGQVVLHGNRNGSAVEVHVAAYGLKPGRSYEVWLANLTIDRGRITGCWASQVGSVTASRRGVARFSGSAPYSPGSHTLQVIVSPDPFASFQGFVTGPIPFQVN